MEISTLRSSGMVLSSFHRLKKLKILIKYKIKNAKLLLMYFRSPAYPSPVSMGECSFQWVKTGPVSCLWGDHYGSDNDIIPSKNYRLSARGLLDRSGQATIENELTSSLIWRSKWHSSQNLGSLTLHLLLTPQTELATFQSFQTVTQLMRVILFYICQAISVDWQEKADRAVMLRHSIHLPPW